MRTVLKNVKPKYVCLDTHLRFVHTGGRQRQRKNYYKMIFRRECSHWGGINGNGNGNSNVHIC